MNKLIQQYNQIKAKYPDAILLFRVGDFYKLFGEDAKTVSAIMKLTLMKKEDGRRPKQQQAFPFTA